MAKSKKKKECKEQLFRLDEAEVKNPYSVIESFFSSVHLGEAKEELWNWLATALSKDGGMYDEGINRSDLITFYENLESLIEAAWLIHQKEDKKGKKSKSFF